MGFRLVPKSVTLNDLERRIWRLFYVISPNSVAFVAKSGWLSINRFSLEKCHKVHQLSTTDALCSSRQRSFLLIINGYTHVAPGNMKSRRAAITSVSITSHTHTRRLYSVHLCLTLTCPLPNLPWVSTCVMTFSRPTSICKCSTTSAETRRDGHHAPPPISSRILSCKSRDFVSLKSNQNLLSKS